MSIHGGFTENNTDFVRSLVDDKCDPELGERVRQHLITLGLETTQVENYDPIAAFDSLKGGIAGGFANLGIDPDDASTKDTPRRYAKMFIGELTKGLNYNFFPKCTATPNGEQPLQGVKVPDFNTPATISAEKMEITNLGAITGHLAIGQGQVMRSEGFDKTLYSSVEVAPKVKGAYDQMVLVRDIEVMSLCEHHLQTIDGFAHIAYIPGKQVLGLSKFARIADFFARRPQIQERMTEQIFEALCFILDTKDVAVCIKATHFCMRARGASQSQASTTTDKMGGRFMSNPSLRKEFFDGIA